jgi:hypothetical protein
MYMERPNAARISSRLEEIIPAAHQGRIFHLFVAAGAERWGRFDLEQNVVSVHESAERGDQELLNLAVTQTILHDGSVHTLAPEAVPNGASVAAVLRY